MPQEKLTMLQTPQVKLKSKTFEESLERLSFISFCSELHTKNSKEGLYIEGDVSFFSLTTKHGVVIKKC